jgi:hypothetical protein
MWLQAVNVCFHANSSAVWCGVCCAEVLARQQAALAALLECPYINLKVRFEAVDGF